MKNKIILLIQVVVSVAILAYLFNSIFEREASEELKPFILNPAISATEAAQKFHITPGQVEAMRARCIVTTGEQTVLDLKNLPLRERALIVWQIGPHGLWAVFQTISPVWFVAAIGCFGMVCLLGIVRWQAILAVQGLALPFKRTTSIFFVGMFFNAFLLGATGGDVIKAWYVAHETKHKKAEAVITVVVDRLIGLMALFVIALIMMAIFHTRVFEDKRLIAFSVFTLVMVLATVIGTVLGFWKGFADKFPGLRGWLKKLPKYDMLQRAINSYRVYASHPKVLLATVAQSLGVHIFVMLSIYCVAQGLHITAADIVDIFLYLPIINSLSALPVSFSGFGVREGMYVEMFSQVGMPAVQALTLSLVGYIVALFWSIVGGFFFLTHRKEITAVEHEAAAAETTAVI